MRQLVITFILLLPIAGFAQQPDVRLELMSLYRMKDATVHALEHTVMRSCERCDWVPWKGALQLTAKADAVTIGADTKPLKVLSLRGGLRMETGVAPARTIVTPVEVRSRGGRLVFVTTLPLEEYVAEVVQGETSGTLPQEALRAIAVAARSYATHFRDRHKAGQFDFCDTTHCQFVQSKLSPAVAAAVEQTRGEILWDRGRAFAAYYHKDCGGRTESASEVWPGATASRARTVTDPYCVRTTQRWRSDISRNKINVALTNAGMNLPRDWDHITVAQRTSSGRAKTLLFGTGNSENGRLIAASSVRFALGRAYGWSWLKSEWYDVSVADDRVIFTGRGTGHGVGLCQLGAAEMARAGKTYREILAFYYPGMTIGVAASGIAWRKSSSAGVDVFTVDAQPPAHEMEMSARAFAWAELHTGLHSPKRPSVYTYPTVEMFRNATGEPGWVAAATKSNKVRVQAFKVLDRRFESVLRHEFTHFLLEMNAAPQTPLWFREGLVMLITGERKSAVAELSPAQMESILRSRSDYKATQAAYGSALAIIARMDRQYGRGKLLSWLAGGIPSNIPAGGVAQEVTDKR